MAEHNDTKTASPSILAMIIDHIAADRLAGTLESLDAYQDRFPGYESAVARAFASLTAECDDIDPLAAEPSTIGGFRVLRPLGRGGQGAVYLAEDPKIGRLVAIKTLDALHAVDPDRLARFRREAALVAKLEDPGICRLCHVGEERRRPYIVMEYVRGASVAELLAEHDLPAHFGLDAILAWCERIARSLHRAHSAGVLHRDVKPANIVLDENQQPVLLDFGLARGADDEWSRLTHTGAELGTPAYMAPEQLSGGDGLDARTDVYALGVTLYEMLTGRRPFAAKDAGELTDAIRHGRYARLRSHGPTWSTDLERVVDKAMDRDLAQRYASAEAFADDLARLRQTLPVLARPVPIPVRARRFVADHPIAAVLIGSLGTALLVSLWSLDTAWTQTDLADRRLTENRELIAATKLQNLLTTNDPDLWRAHPATIRKKSAWLAAAEELLDSLQRFRADRETLRRRGENRGTTPRSSATPDDRLARIRVELRNRLADDPEREVLQRLEGEAAAAQRRARSRAGDHWTFGDPNDEWRHAQLSSLIHTLDTINDAAQAVITPRVVRHQLARARAIEAETIGEPHAAEWRRCLRALADDERFAGLDLTPQIGLVPLGPDPDSQLEEFALASSGACPTRDGTRRLQLEARHAAVLVLVPGGGFTVGEPADKTDRRVALQPFLVGKHEITQRQWQQVMNANPATYRPDNPTLEITPMHPVETVTWHAADLFARRLGCRLPTEAQWEFACLAGRDGRDGRFAWADASTQQVYERENLGDRALDGSAGKPDDGYPATAPIGSFTANAFGLFDMHGNVCEWCLDRFERKSALRHHVVRGDGRSLASTDPRRVFKGGSWYIEPDHAHARMRHRNPPGHTNSNIGVRIVRTWPTKDTP